MDILYPRIPRHRLWPMARIALLGAVIAGAYGALHDQISYSISPEYFTKLKFDQFSWANIGLPERAYASEVGFLASWWVGLIAGWFLGRVGLVEVSESGIRHPIAKSFAIVTIVALIAGVTGWLLGFLSTISDLSGWEHWQTKLHLRDLRSFVIVAYLHFASYVGALIGLVGAALYVRISLRRVRRRASMSQTPDIRIESK